MECEFDSKVEGGAPGWLITMGLFIVWVWAVWSALNAETLFELAKSVLIAWLADTLAPIRKILVCKG